MKGKIKKFFTMDVRDHRGFTLVELIVVIAILAILAGVGTAGYAGYIKSANKNADKTLVGNIIRAIETGVYSTAFELDESMALAEIEYPVGFVVVNTDGTVVYKSGTQVTEGVKDECKFETVKVYYAEKISDWDCNNGSNIMERKESKYQITYKEIPICTTHCTIKDYAEYAEEETKLDSYPTNYTASCSKSGFFWSHSHTASAWVTVPAKSYYVNDTSIGDSFDAYKASTNDSTKCAYAYANQYDGFTGNSNVIQDQTGPIYQAMVAAFGNSDGTLSSDVKLVYDGWSADEGITHATVYNNGSHLIDVTETQANTLLTYNKRLGGAFNSYLSGSYSEPEDMLDSFAEYMIQKYPTKESWVTVWNNAANGSVDYTFGMNESGNYHNDYIYAATVGYNSCFASYLIINGIDEQLAELIENYTTLPNGDIGGMMDKANKFGIDLGVLPRTVNSYAFAGQILGGNSDKYKLENIFVTGAKELNNPSTNTQYTEDEAKAIFEQIKNLYTQYTNSSVCEENGAAFYDIMKTLVTTSDVASASGDYFGYYSNYLEEMENLYNEATNYIQNGNIVIMVYVKNGEVTCDVYPSTANPRKD